MPNSLRGRALELLWPVAISLALLAAWEAAVRGLGVRSIILPAPSEIVETMVDRPNVSVRARRSYLAPKGAPAQ